MTPRRGAARENARDERVPRAYTQTLLSHFPWWCHPLPLQPLTAHRCSRSPSSRVSISCPAAPAPWRPVRAERTPNQQLTRKATPEMRVVRVIAIVPQHEHVPSWDTSRTHSIADALVRQIRFLCRAPVDEESTSPHRHPVTRNGNNAFDGADAPRASPDFVRQQL